MSFYIVNGFDKIKHISLFVWFCLLLSIFKVGISSFITLGYYYEWFSGKENFLLVWSVIFFFSNFCLFVLYKNYNNKNRVELDDSFVYVYVAKPYQRDEVISLKIEDIKMIEIDIENKEILIPYINNRKIISFSRVSEAVKLVEEVKGRLEDMRCK
ncbi:MAG: hypothetical protein N4A33_11545 [Bacteriovoracaceae bacterium]|nr:hypothetical protein [Bacteriovoracaceae bacterium]